MTSTDIQAVLNPNRANVNQEDYPLNPDIVTVPAGAKAVRVFPNKVHLKIERSAEVLMEIQPVLVGQPKAGLKIDQVDLLPVQGLRPGSGKARSSPRTGSGPVPWTSPDWTRRKPLKST